MLNKILDKLSKKNRDLLSYALENGIPQLVEYEPGKFVAVLAQQLNNLIVEQNYGLYSTGILKARGDSLR